MTLHESMYFSPYDLAKIENFIYFISGILFMFLLGRILHELAHYLAVDLFGGEVTEVRLGFTSGGIEYVMPAEKPLIYDRFINLAPQITGLFLGVPYFIWLVSNSADPLLLFLVGVFLFSYMALGGAADFSMAVARGEGQLWTPDGKEQVAVLSLGMLVSGFALIGMPVNAPKFIADFAPDLGMALAFGGVLLFGLDLLINRQEELG